MRMYVNYGGRTQRAKHENKTIGIVLCSEKNAAMVKITLPEDNDRMAAAAESLMRAFSKVGVIVLIDEATGYQRVECSSHP